MKKKKESICVGWLLMKRKVLMIMNSLGCGGTENFVMNLYRCWDREKLQVDFLATDTNGTQYFENEIIEKGGIIYKVPGKNRKPLTHSRMNSIK